MSNYYTAGLEPVRYDQVKAMLVKKLLKEYRKDEQLQEEVEPLAAALPKVNEKIGLGKTAVKSPCVSRLKINRLSSRCAPSPHNEKRREKSRRRLRLKAPRSSTPPVEPDQAQRLPKHCC